VSAGAPFGRADPDKITGSFEGVIGRAQTRRAMIPRTSDTQGRPDGALISALPHGFDSRLARGDRRQPSLGGLIVGWADPRPAILMPGMPTSISLQPDMRRIARKSLDMSGAGIHASMAALARCAAPIDAIAKVPSLRKDRVGGGRRRCGWVRLGRRRIAPCRWVLPGIQSPRSGSPCVISMTCKCPVRLRAHVPNPAGIPRLYLIDIREDCRMPHRSRLGRRTHLRRA
jgi:hypothetical protein